MRLTDLFLNKHSSMIIFGFDLAKAPWLMIGYILVSIVALVYGTNYVNTQNSVRGIIFGIGFFLILMYFGIRWFGSRIPELKSWPPVINTCPDYLTYVTISPKPINERTVTSGCIDTLGVSSSKTAKRLQISTAEDYKSGSGADRATSLTMFEYTSADIKASTKSSELKTICDRCSELGITWEGVYDGDACVGISSSANARAAVEQCLLSA